MGHCGVSGHETGALGPREVEKRAAIYRCLASFTKTSVLSSKQR